MITDNWTDTIVTAIQNLGVSFVEFIPKLIGALIVFIVGFFIAFFLSNLVALILEKIRFNQLFDSSHFKRALEKADLKVTPSTFIGNVVKWILIIVSLQIAVGILGWTDFEEILGRVTAYLPNVVLAALIFVVAVIIADIIAKVIVVATESTTFAYSHLAGEIVRWAIWVFAILIILHQLGVAQPLIETLFTGLIGVLVLAFGLSFGLGGKDIAASFLEDLRRKLKG
jgi:hypothetical protein